MRTTNHGSEPREMLLTKMKEAVEAYIDVLLKDEHLSHEDCLTELDTAKHWLEEKWSALERRRSEIQRSEIQRSV